MRVVEWFCPFFLLFLFCSVFFVLTAAPLTTLCKCTLKSDFLFFHWRQENQSRRKKNKLLNRSIRTSLSFDFLLSFSKVFQKQSISTSRLSALFLELFSFFVHRVNRNYKKRTLAHNNYFIRRSRNILVLRFFF